jgi:hypothetical protein
MALALVGIALAHLPALGLAGYALVGLGLAPVFPTVVVWIDAHFGERADRVAPWILAVGNLGPVVGAPAVGAGGRRLGAGRGADRVGVRPGGARRASSRRSVGPDRPTCALGSPDRGTTRIGCAHVRRAEHPRRPPAAEIQTPSDVRRRRSSAPSRRSRPRALVVRLGDGDGNSISVLLRHVAGNLALALARALHDRR